MYKRIMQIVPWIFVAVIILLAVWGWRSGLFSSQEELQAFIMSFGAAAGLVFLAVQIIQVIIPILPGGVSLVAGVVLFGPVWGFILNYLGICTGSVIAFYIARRYGKALLHKMFDEKTIEKYEAWTTKKNRFIKLFALTIIFPFFPDDFLCYLAGTTNVSQKAFFLVIFLGKIPSIALYSLGFTTISALLEML